MSTMPVHMPKQKGSKSKPKSLSTAQKTMSPVYVSQTQQSVDMTVATVELQAYSEYHARAIMFAMYGATSGSVISVHEIETKANKRTGKKTPYIFNDIPQHGARKWQTYYEIHSYAYKFDRPIGPSFHGGGFEAGPFNEKLDAVQKMKELTIERSIPMYISIHKKLIDGEPITASIEPEINLHTYRISFRVIV